MLDSRYEEAIQLIETSFGQSANQIVLNITKAEALIKLGRLADGESLLKKIKSSLTEEKNQSYYSALIATNYGSLFLNQGRFDLGIEELEKAIKLFEADNRSGSLEAAEALSYLGNLYMAAGKYQQADEQLQMVLTIRTEKLPEAHELIAASYNDLGLVYTQLDVNKAFDYYEKSLAIYEKLHGGDHPKLAIANTNLGVLNRSEKLYGDAVVYFDPALPADLAEKLVAIIDNPVYIEQLSKKARDRSLLYDWSMAARLTWDAIENLYLQEARAVD